MKKGLSVLLIAAALFGFYGGATNLNDVLACKDYFTSASGASDDMQRLEDGLNQLKENEQAYLDGQVALAEGEKTLADGYATLADGERQYAEGLAAYKAAPGQLAAGREGLESLKKAIKGINDLKAANGYPKWKKNYEKMRDARELFYAGTKDLAGSLTQLAAFLPKGDQKAYVAAVDDVAKDDGKQTYKDYNTYIKSTNELAKDIPKIQKAVKESLEGAKTINGALDDAGESNLQHCGTVANSEVYAGLQKLSAMISDESQKEAFLTAVEAEKNAYEKQFVPGIKKDVEDAITAQVTSYMQSSEGQQAVGQKMAEGMSQKDAIEAVKNEKIKEIQPGIQQQVTQQYAQAAQQNSKLTEARKGINGAVAQIVETLTGVDETLSGSDVKKLLDGLKDFNDATKKNDKGKNGAKQLLEGQDDSIADGVQQLVSGILGDKIMKKALIKKVGKAKVKSMKKYGTKNSPLYSKNSDFAQFNKKMSKNPDVMSFLKAALPVVKARLAQGQKEYAEGLKSYREAPGKLADARQQLAEGRQALADGEKQLEDGKAQLAQYEDGEQQVRDGLATLVGTDAMGNVQSIADRIGNDTDFDNGDTHLELDEGLSAVQAGKGYAADLTAAVTDEIMGRAVGTGLLIGAGVLAVLAALLSFLKKNKGAGVFAVLAALAGCIGAVMGNNAGTQFSSIAGSAVGATPWIAAGILAAVAAVHAIVHFVAKKAA